MWENIIEAGREELQLAQQVGDIDEEGNGLITVIADGAWSKRSYKVNYDAPSGVVSTNDINNLLVSNCLHLGLYCRCQDW